MNPEILNGLYAQVVQCQHRADEVLAQLDELDKKVSELEANQQDLWDTLDERVIALGAACTFGC